MKKNKTINFEEAVLTEEDVSDLSEMVNDFDTIGIEMGLSYRAWDEDSDNLPFPDTNDELDFENRKPR